MSKWIGDWLLLDFDLSDWWFPLSIRYQAVGNRRRPYNLTIAFLCFSVVFCIDCDSRKVDEKNETDN